MVNEAGSRSFSVCPTLVNSIISRGDEKSSGTSIKGGVRFGKNKFAREVSQ